MDILAGKAQYDASYFINSYIEYLKEVINKKEQVIKNQDHIIEMFGIDIDNLKNENSNEAENQGLKDRIEQLENLLDVSNKEYNKMNIRLNGVEQQNEKLLYVLGGILHNGHEKDASVADRYLEGMERLKTIGLSIADLKF